jgi:hypothetical protein
LALCVSCTLRLISQVPPQEWNDFPQMVIPNWIGSVVRRNVQRLWPVVDIHNRTPLKKINTEKRFWCIELIYKRGEKETQFSRLLANIICWLCRCCWGSALFLHYTLTISVFCCFVEFCFEATTAVSGTNSRIGISASMTFIFWPCAYRAHYV